MEIQQKDNRLAKSLIENLQICNTKSILQVIYKANLGGHCSFGKEDWIFISEEIKKDFPKITINELDSLIMRGVKGEFGRSEFISMQKIYLWLNKGYFPEPKEKVVI